jgi:hypothetical protein
MRRSFVSLIAAVFMVAAMAVAPATAQPRQNGLVNLNLSGNTVQIPVAIAANVCDLNVAAILAAIREDEDGETNCDGAASAFPEATMSRGGGDVRQDGLINVNISDNIIQVPIAAAVNICDVNVAILLAAILDQGATECKADAGAGGIVFPPAEPA